MALADVTDALGGDKKSPERPPHGTEVVLQLKRSRLGRLMGVQVIGVGSSAPDNCIRNEDLAALGYDADWIVQRTGIVERRHALPGMATSDLAVAAAERCIAAAGVSPRRHRLSAAGHRHARQAHPRHRQRGAGTVGTVGPGDGRSRLLRELHLRHDHRHAVCGQWLQPAGAGDRRRLQLADGQPGRPADVSAVWRCGRGGAARGRRPQPGVARLCGRLGRGRGRFALPTDGRVARAIQRRRRRGRPPFPSHGGPAGLQVGHSPAARDDRRSAGRQQYDPG